MKVDLGLSLKPAYAASTAAAAEAEGYNGMWAAETDHDPFVACTLAAASTETMEIGTSIAIAFARSPMTLASTANDLQVLSEGRFVLGLGSQIKPHIERRFSMPWSRPAARMREFVLALRAIWDAWENGSNLDFRGDFYTHTLMTPMFDPGPHGFGPPKVFLAGVGPLMTEVAGEVADGFICHGFSTERYFREHTLPALERGRAKAGKTMHGFEIVAPGFVATGTNDASLASAVSATRSQMAFYGSTPAYKPVLDLHGWGDLQPELNAMSKRGEWVEMGALITDEILETMAVVGLADEIAPELLKRYGDVVSRVTGFERPGSGPSAWSTIRGSLRDAKVSGP